MFFVESSLSPVTEVMKKLKRFQPAISQPLSETEWELLEGYVRSAYQSPWLDGIAYALDITDNLELFLREASFGGKWICLVLLPVSDSNRMARVKFSRKKTKRSWRVSKNGNPLRLCFPELIREEGSFDTQVVYGNFDVETEDDEAARFQAIA